MSLPNYYDLESYEDEWRDAVSINEMKRLAAVLQVTVLDLVAEAEAEGIDLKDHEHLAQHIASWIQSGGSKTDLSWEVDGILKEPNRIGEMPIDFLQDLGTETGFDWRSYLKT